MNYLNELKLKCRTHVGKRLPDFWSAWSFRLLSTQCIYNCRVLITWAEIEWTTCTRSVVHYTQIMWDKSGVSCTHISGKTWVRSLSKRPGYKRIPYDCNRALFSGDYLLLTATVWPIAKRPLWPTCSSYGNFHYAYSSRDFLPHIILILLSPSCNLLRVPTLQV